MKPTEDQQRSVLSIDLGASYTKVAWRPRWSLDPDQTDAENRFVLPSLPIRVQRDFFVPSVAYNPGDGQEWLFGAQAALITPNKQGRLFKNWKAVLFDQSASIEQAAEAVEVAQRFLSWLCQEIVKSEPGLDFSGARTRFCLPALENFQTGAGKLRQAAVAAGWPEHEMQMASEPEANVIGLASTGRNCVNITAGYAPLANLMRIYDPSCPLMRAAQNAANGRQPSRLIVIDIGAFTTDFAICEVSDSVKLGEQFSFKHGIADLDSLLVQKIADQGIDGALLALVEMEKIKTTVYKGSAYMLSQAHQSAILADNCMLQELHRFADEVLNLGRAQIGRRDWFVLTGGGANIETISTRIRGALMERGCRDIQELLPDQNEWLATALDVSSFEKTKRTHELKYSRIRQALVQRGCRKAQKLFPVSIRWFTRSLDGTIDTDGRGDIGTAAVKIREALVKRGFLDAVKWFPDHDQRLATALGGASVILDFSDPADTSAKKFPHESNGSLMVSLPCECAGANKECVKCGGTGMRTRLDSGAKPRSGERESGGELIPAEKPSQPSGEVLPKAVLREVTPKPRSGGLPPRSKPVQLQEPDEFIDASAIAECWRGQENKAKQQFGLEGWMGQLVFGVGQWSAESQRRVLQDHSSAAGRAAWLRLLCLGACLGFRAKTQYIETFWKNRLPDVWRVLIPNDLNQLEDKDYDRQLNDVFVNAIHREFNDMQTTGEDAELWRRVFYDFRKLHHFVYRNDLPCSLLELAPQPGLQADALVNFLKSGFLPGGNKRWVGAIGQSMTAPLLFLLRELRRLEMIGARFDASCFYMNSPARRVARQLGWITVRESAWFDIESLVEMSRACHERMKSELPDLLPFFDIPLQWYAFQNLR